MQIQMTHHSHGISPCDKPEVRLPLSSGFIFDLDNNTLTKKKIKTAKQIVEEVINESRRT